MQNPDSQAVVLRFFAAIRELKARRVIRGQATFCRRHGINRRHMYLQEREPWRDIVQLAWLTYIIEDYGVSALWLMTGKGEMFDGKSTL